MDVASLQNLELEGIMYKLALTPRLPKDIEE